MVCCDTAIVMCLLSPYTHTHTHTHTHTLTHSHTHTHTHTLAHSRTHSLSLTHTHTHTHTHSLSHTHIHTLSHILTHTHTHSLPHSPPPLLLQWWCWSYWYIHLHPCSAGATENWGSGRFLPVHQVCPHTEGGARTWCGKCDIFTNGLVECVYTT